MENAAHSQPAPDGALTVGDVIALYQRHCEAKGVHCPESRADRLRTLALFCVQYGKLPVTEAKAFHLSDFIESQPGWKSLSTKRYKANTVRACFQWAADEERITRNPYRRVRYDSAPPRPPMPDDVLADVQYASNKRFERALRFLRLTGCRTGELCDLTWAGVDLERGLAVIPKHKSYRHTGKPKVLPLTPAAVELLKEIRSKQEPDYDGHVFLNNRDKPWTRRTLGQQLTRLKKRGVIETRATLHSIRHQFATEAIRNGAPLKMVSLALGHAGAAITEKYYVHVSAGSDEVRQAAAASMPKAELPPPVPPPAPRQGGAPW